MSKVGVPMSDVAEELQKLKLKAEELCDLSISQSAISGMPKLIRMCKAESQFVERLLRHPGKVSQSHLNSSNLAHLQGILRAVEVLSGVSQVLHPFRLPNVDHPVQVDVVCDYGRTWVKVIARNSKALLLETAGQQAFGEKTILDQARQFHRLAKLHPHNYLAPRVMFLFFHEVPQKLVKNLERIGITVIELGKLSGLECCEAFDPRSSRTFQCLGTSQLQGSFCEVVKSALSQEDDESGKKRVLPINVMDAENSEFSASIQPAENSEAYSGLKNFCSEDCVCAAYFSEKSQMPGEVSFVDPAVLDIKVVNLDITTLFALVSNLCHGNCHFVFQEKILTQQAVEEQNHPLLPELLYFLHGKQLFVCETALSDFQKILSTVGGPKEKERARLLLQYVAVIPDLPSKRSLNLRTTAKLSHRAKTIFGTGDSLKAVTTTANQSFVRAAAQFSADFVVFVHGARALTEQKEASACPWCSCLERSVL